MFSTTASKLVACVFLVAVSASGTAGVQKFAPTGAASRDVPVVLSSNSLLVATLANGEIQTQWMSTSACERAASAVLSGNGVAGVRSDGVRVYIARINCSTPRVEVAPDTVALDSSQSGN